MDELSDPVKDFINQKARVLKIPEIKVLDAMALCFMAECRAMVYEGLHRVELEGLPRETNGTPMSGENLYKHMWIRHRRRLDWLKDAKWKLEQIEAFMNGPIYKSREVPWGETDW